MSVVSFKNQLPRPKTRCDKRELQGKATLAMGGLYIFTPLLSHYHQ